MAKFSLPIADGGAPTDATATPTTATTPAAHKTRAQGGTVMDEIAYEVASNRIVLYMKGSPQMPQCGFSARASQILSSFNVPYHTVNILADAEKRQGIKDFSDWPTIPQVYINGEFVGGSDILMEMYQNGELEALIKA